MADISDISIAPKQQLKAYAKPFSRVQIQSVLKEPMRTIRPVVSSVVTRTQYDWRRFLPHPIAPRFGYQLNLMVVGAVMLGSFTLGAVTVLESKFSSAETEGESQVLSVQTTVRPEDEYLNLFAEDLAEASKLLVENNVTGADYSEQEFVARKEKLKAYLAGKRSPFAQDEYVLETLLQQPHMQVMLAITFAESNFGKACYLNNCSGIGGSNIVPYRSTVNWIIAFNRLIERRYKGQTFEQMCGVYVQPCNQNWLKATNQVMAELKAHGVY